MPLPHYAGRSPSPAPPEPLPLWPLVMGPMLGTLAGIVVSLGARIPGSFSGTFGFGIGMLFGLVGVLIILTVRRQNTSQTWMVAAAALAVLLGLVRMWYF